MITPLMTCSLRISSWLFSYIWKKPLTFCYKTGNFAHLTKLSALKSWLFLTFFLLPLNSILPVWVLWMLRRGTILNLSISQIYFLVYGFLTAVFATFLEIILRSHGSIFG